METYDDDLSELSEYSASLENRISDFLKTESLRYEAQANELLNTGFLNLRSGGVLIKYKISGDQFCYQYKSKTDGSVQESEILAPDERADQIATLKFIFAQSEAEVSL